MINFPIVQTPTTFDPKLSCDLLFYYEITISFLLLVSWTPERDTWQILLSKAATGQDSPDSYFQVNQAAI